MKHLSLCFILIILLFAITLQAKKQKHSDNDQKSMRKGIKHKKSIKLTKEYDYNKDDDDDGEGGNDPENDYEDDSDNDNDNDNDDDDDDDDNYNDELGGKKGWKPVKSSDSKVLAAVKGSKKSILKQRKQPSKNRISVKKAFKWSGNPGPKYIGKYKLNFKITSAKGKPIPKNGNCEAEVVQLKNKKCFKALKVSCDEKGKEKRHEKAKGSNKKGKKNNRRRTKKMKIKVNKSG